MFQVRNLTVRIGRKNIINQMSLAPKSEGGVIGLLGPNGAGKTTLLNTLARNINTYSGSVHLEQCAVLLPDKPYLYGYLSVEECVDLFDQLYADFNKEKALTLIEWIGLDRRLKIKQCSKGMSEQLHIILAISREVALYLFDEPLAAVDPLSRERLLELMVNHRAPGSTLLISTHLIEDVDHIFDEVIFMAKGQVVFHEKAQEALKRFDKRLEEIYKEVMRDVYPSQIKYSAV